MHKPPCMFSNVCNTQARVLFKTFPRRFRVHLFVLHAFMIEFFNFISSRRAGNMAAYAQSAASLEHRAAEIGLSTADIDSFKAHDIKNFNNLAFSVCSQPGQVDDRRLQELLDNVFPGGMSLGLQAAVRQLAYEALTVAVAAIRQRVEHSEDAPVRKLPAQERDERLARLKARITGFTITGDHEPGYGLIDSYASMMEESTFKYIPLSKCVSREQELHASKADKKIVVMENQQLHVRDKNVELSADLSNELRVQLAITRRGLAMDVAGLITYATYEKVMREYMSHLTRPAPPGYKPADVAAVLRADKELWTRAADRCRSKLRVQGDGTLPMDNAIEELYMTASVLFHLLPLPGSKGAKRSRDSSQSTERPKKKKKQPKKDRRDDPPKGAPRTRVPEGLRGFSGVNSSKQRVCFDFNLAHGCSNPTEMDKKKPKCKKGFHECIQCGGMHPLHECTKR